MKKYKRRSFLKYCGLSFLVGLTPRLYATTSDSDHDVQYFLKEHSLFEAYRSLFNKRIRIQPKVIAVCHNEAGVKKAVRYANHHKLNMSIKSGGHSFEGFSLIHNGMVIDVSKMNKLELNNNNQLTAEPAVRLAQLYAECLPKGRLLPSGSCGTVGLAGITLGGGYGLFSRQFGLTSDHLTGVRMIDAGGNTLDSDDFPDLLWGCRGAGNGNFGVITQLRYNTVPAPSTLYQHRFRSFKLNSRQATILAKFWFEQCRELPLHAYSAFVLNGTTLTIMLTSTEHDTVMTKILEQFDRRMDKNYNLKPDPVEVGIQYYYGHSKALYFKNISGGYYNGYDDIEKCIEQLFTSVINTPGMLYQINTLGGEINNPSAAKKSAYIHRQDGYLGEIQSYWNKREDEKRYMDEMKSMQEILHANGVTKHYVNYPDVNIRDHGHAYYGSSYKRLQKLKQQLDPDSHFTYAQSIKPS
jgi:FAD/FMN-containing dehydrogenase